MPNMDKNILDNPFFTATAKPEEPNTSVPMDFPPFVRVDGDKVFFVENGKAHWVINPNALKALGGSFDKIQTVDKKDFFKLNKNVETITPDNAKNYIQEAVIVDETKVEEKPKEEFKTYDEPNPIPVKNAPTKEPVKGFTSIILPAYFLNYPLFHETGHCIGSIQEHTDMVKTPYEIILVVNGKTGIGLSNPQESRCQKVIEIKENVGYGAAMNRGIRVAKGEYIVLMSNDVLVFDYWLDDFQEALKYKDLVMSTPMYGLPYARALASREIREKYLKDNNGEIKFTDFRDFACVATRKSLFDEIGLFDEAFYLYKEDIDFFKRMEAKGKTYASTGVVGKALINTFHVIGMTTVNMTPEEQKSKQSADHFKEKYGTTA